MMELVLAFVLIGPVERPVVGAPIRVAAGIVNAQPVRSVLKRMAKVRPVRRMLKNRHAIRRVVRLVGRRRA